MKITNYTRYPVADKLETLADVLGIPPSVTLQVKQTPQPMAQGDTTLRAILRPADYGTDIYELYLSHGLSAAVLDETIAHECVHLQQYACGRLKIETGCVHFEGKQYDYNAYDPFSPWEREAFTKQGKLFKLIHKRK